MKIITEKENFPIDGESYLVGECEGRFFFTWGSEYPYMDLLPEEDILDGEGGIEWYHTEEEALKAYLGAIEASSMLENNI